MSGHAKSAVTSAALNPLTPRPLDSSTPSTLMGAQRRSVRSLTRQRILQHVRQIRRGERLLDTRVGDLVEELARLGSEGAAGDEDEAVGHLRVLLADGGVQ